MKNTGVNLEMEQKELLGSEWMFGAGSKPCIFSVPIIERKEYLPRGEIQKGKDDYQDCVTRKGGNALEIKFTAALRKKRMKDENAQWLRDKGYVVVHEGKEYVEFSDRFIAILSGTTPRGNSLKAPAHAVYEHGLIPKRMFPGASNLSWNQYHDKRLITQEMTDLAKEFKKRFRINYEQVFTVDMEAALKRDMFGVVVFAWPTPVDGEYRRKEGDPLTHDVLAFEPLTYVFDNYPETASDPREWVKKLAENYPFYPHNYRLFVSSETTETETKTALTVFEVLARFGLIEAFAIWWAQFWSPAKYPEPKEEEVVVPEEPKPIQETPQERLLQESRLMIGRDASPQDYIPDEVACAVSISNIINAVTTKTFPRISGTWTLVFEWFNKDKRFKKIKVSELQPGDILAYATGTVQGTKIRGHVFVCDENGVLMSNNSDGGLWDTHWTLGRARKRWERAGYKPHCFRLISL